MKTDSVRQLFDLRLLAGKEVPSLAVGLGLQMLVHASDISLLRAGCVLRRLIRIEACRHHLVLLARREFQHTQSACLADQLFPAKHGAGVIHQVQDHWTTGVKVIAQLYLLARLVYELQIERDLLIESLIDADIRQVGWTDLRSGLRALVLERRGRLRESEGRRRQQYRELYKGLHSFKSNC